MGPGDHTFRSTTLSTFCVGQDFGARSRHGNNEIPEKWKSLTIFSGNSQKKYFPRPGKSPKSQIARNLTNSKVKWSEFHQNAHFGPKVAFSQKGHFWAEKLKFSGKVHFSRKSHFLPPRHLRTTQIPLATGPIQAWSPKTLHFAPFPDFGAKWSHFA